MYFDASNKDQSFESIERSETTKLTAFFDLCKTDEYAQTLLYENVPEFYTWNTGTKTWNRRKKQNIDERTVDAVGRIYSISPVNVELYALRLLLNHVRGPKSHEDLTTVKGAVYDTFQAVAIARDLVKDDKLWIDCMKEANEHQTNIYLLRKLFVTIILNCDVGNHKAFLFRCKDMLIADFVHKYKNEFPKRSSLKIFMQHHKDKENGELYTDTLFNKNFGHFKENDIWTLEKFALNTCLCQLEIMMKDMMNKSLEDFGLPTPNIEKEKHLQNLLIEKYVANEDDLNPEVAKEFFNANHKLLNTSQQIAFNRVKNLIETKKMMVKLYFWMHLVVLERHLH